MFTKLGLATLLFGAVTTTSMAFDGKLTTEFRAAGDQGQTTVTYYDSSCTPAGQPECIVTYLWCGSPRDIGFEVKGVPDAVLGNWLVKDGAKATLSSGKHVLSLRPTEMITNDMAGGWDLKFNAVSAEGDEDAQSWFAGLATVPKITMHTAKGDDVLPMDGENGKQLSLFLAACRTEGT
jgi:hypothetical protein